MWPSDLSDDGTLFVAGAPRFIRSPWFHRPVDLAPAVREVSSDNFSSNTTLGGGSDIYVLNRGDNSVVRINQAGQVLAARRIVAALPSFRVNGIAVSENGQTLWVSAVMAGGNGVVLQMPAFGAGFVTPTMVSHATQAGATTPSAMGADMFATELSPLQGLGPLFNGRSCGDCHNTPIEGGMGATADTFGTRVGRIAGGGFDDLSGHGGPVARTHSIASFGFFCGLPTGVSPLANVTSKRSAMTLRGTALLDFVQIPDILTAQAAEPAEVRGKLNVLADGRPGKFGWKAQFATLIEFMGDAFTRRDGHDQPAGSGRRGERLWRQLPEAGDRTPCRCRPSTPSWPPGSSRARRQLYLLGGGDHLRGRRLRQLPHASRCRAPGARSTSIRICWSTTWGRPWLISSWPGPPAAATGERRRSGAPPSASTSCTTAARAASPRPSRRTVVRVPPPLPPTPRSIRLHSKRC